jgi:hypothetical protein
MIFCGFIVLLIFSISTTIVMVSNKSTNMKLLVHNVYSCAIYIHSSFSQNRWRIEESKVRPLDKLGSTRILVSLFRHLACLN